ncbi:MAG: hypothetical protein Q9162_007210 [Coniocarpon cinnabarinum]
MASKAARSRAPDTRDDEAPPAYSQASSPSTAVVGQATATPPNIDTIRKNLVVSKPDDQFAFLSTFDTAFLIDDSYSMTGARWEKLARTIEAIAPICVHHDHDGIGLHFLNASEHDDPHVDSVAKVDEIFKKVHPSNGTPTGPRLGQIMTEYLDKLEEARGDSQRVKPLNIIVITDGMPNNEILLEKALETAAKRLDKMRFLDDEAPPRYQLGVQFFQIGNDKMAKSHLWKLDNYLHRECYCRDIVDAVPSRWFRRFNQKLILKTVLGAVSDRYDKQRVGMSGSVS